MAKKVGKKSSKENTLVLYEELNTLFTSYHGKIKEFNELIKFHEINEDFQVQMFDLIDNFINSDEVVLKIACLGCKGGGKSSNMILIALMILLTYREDMMLFYISGKEKQSKQILMSEIRHLINSAKLHKEELGEIIELASDSVTNRLTGKSLDILTYSQASGGLTIAGIHCSGLHLFIMDEAPSIQESAYQQMLGTGASGKSIYLCGGNPDDDKINFFWSVMTDPEDGDQHQGWHRFYINYLELKRPSPKQIEGMLVNYPVGTVGYTKYVLGRYPDKDENILIDHTLVQTCLRKYDVPNHFPELTILHLDKEMHYVEVPNRNPSDARAYITTTNIGVDLAEGVNKGYTVITARTGHLIEIIYYSNTVGRYEVAGILEHLYRKYSVKWSKDPRVPPQRIAIYVDADGTGRSFSTLARKLGYVRSADNMTNVFNRASGVGIHYNYGDVRSSLYAKFNAWLDEGETNRSIVSYDRPYLQITNYEIIIKSNYYEKLSKRIIVEAKQTKFNYEDAGRKRLIPKSELPSSPDILDSIAYTFFYDTYSNMV